jgi:hypothetical protein
MPASPLSWLLPRNKAANKPERLRLVGERLRLVGERLRLVGERLRLVGDCLGRMMHMIPW